MISGTRLPLPVLIIGVVSSIAIIQVLIAFNLTIILLLAPS